MNGDANGVTGGGAGFSNEKFGTVIGPSAYAAPEEIASANVPKQTDENRIPFPILSSDKNRPPLAGVFSIQTLVRSNRHFVLPRGFPGVETPDLRS